MKKLLTKNDPNPFLITNAKGSYQVILVCDHASSAIPLQLNNLGLEDTHLKSHIACDHGALDVFLRLSSLFNCVGISSGFSRLVIDYNRNPNSITSIPSINDGIEIPGNKILRKDDIEQRLQECFMPYHQAINMQIQKARKKNIIPAIISIHSFTDFFECIKRPWHIGVLWGRDPRISIPLLENLYAKADLCVGDNQPYSGREAYGYCLETHAVQHGFPHVLVEIRQDLISTKEKANAWGDLLYDALKGILNNESIFRVEYYK